MDHEGRPLVLYHGSPTPDTLTRFVPGGGYGSSLSGDAYGVACYFTSSAHEASHYAREDGAVFPVYVRGEMLVINASLPEAQSARITQLANDVMLPSDRARFEIVREVKRFTDPVSAEDFFHSQKANWEVFGDGMCRAEPRIEVIGSYAAPEGYEISYTNYDAKVGIKTGEDAFTLFRAIGWSNMSAAGLDGMVLARDGGAVWVVMNRPDYNIKSALGNSGDFNAYSNSLLDESVDELSLVLRPG